MVIIFGLFYGLVFLPVILSLVGPKPHSHSPIDRSRDKTTSNNGLHEVRASDKNDENGTEMVKFINTRPNDGHQSGDDRLLNRQMES